MILLPVIVVLKPRYRRQCHQAKFSLGRGNRPRVDPNNMVLLHQQLRCREESVDDVGVIAQTLLRQRKVF